MKEGNLDYLLEAVNGEMFGKPLYPTLADKAGLYCHSIVCNHIFSDGNKRTGLESALLFLYRNGYMLVLELTSLDIINFILRVAEGNVSLEECQLCLKKILLNFNAPHPITKPS